MPRRACSEILSVPMSKPRYTAVESQLMISPLSRSATASASALFPVAVGPRTATTEGVGIRLSDSWQHAHAQEDVDRKCRDHDQEAELLRACWHHQPRVTETA